MQTEHDRRLDEIVRREIFNIVDNPKVIAKEVMFRDRNRTVCEPDIIVFGGNILYLIEYKVGATGRFKAQQQLETAENYVRSVLKYQGCIKQVYLHG